MLSSVFVLALLFSQAVPRRLWLDKNGIQLRQWPIEEIEHLRQESEEISNVEISNGRLVRIGAGITTVAQVLN